MTGASRLDIGNGVAVESEDNYISYQSDQQVPLLFTLIDGPQSPPIDTSHLLFNDSPIHIFGSVERYV